MNKPPQSWLTTHSLFAFYASTYSLSWLLWVPLALSSQGIISFRLPSILGVVVGGLSPSLMAILLTIIEKREDGLRDLRTRWLHWRVAPQWYFFVLLAPAAIMACAIILVALFTCTLPEIPKIDNWFAVIALFGVTFIIGGPLGEEIGWRGYALPRFLTSRSPLTASIVVGVLWGIWHLPLFWIRDSIQAVIPLGWFMVSIVAESILYTWIYNHTQGSILVVCLFHTAINTWAKIILLPSLANGLNVLLVSFSLEVILAVSIIVLTKSVLYIRY
jgi:membrane protease YdiL (CAAX protease family)